MAEEPYAAAAAAAAGMLHSFFFLGFNTHTYMQPVLKVDFHALSHSDFQSLNRKSVNL